jgi:hypothetical protein
VKPFGELRGAGAETEDEAPGRHLGETGSRHRERTGAPTPDAQDAGPQHETVGANRQLGHQDRDVVRPRLGQEVPAVAQLLGERGDAQERFAAIVEGHHTDTEGPGVHGRRVC